MLTVACIQQAGGDGSEAVPFTLGTSEGVIVTVFQSNRELGNFALLANRYVPEGMELTGIGSDADLEQLEEILELPDARLLLDEDPEYARLILALAAAP